MIRQPLADVSVPARHCPWRRAGGPAAAIVLLCYAWVICAAPPRDDSDWSHLWLGGRMVASGSAAELYNPQRQLEVYREADPHGRDPAIWKPRNRILGSFNYPPPAALLYAGLAWLPMDTACVVHAFWTLGLTIILALGVTSLSAGRVPASYALIAVMLHPAFFINLALGQNAVMTTTLLVLAWACAARRRDFAAGLLLGVLVFKPNWLLAAVWIPVLFGRWRMLAGMVAGASGVCALTACITGWQAFFDYLEVAGHVSALHHMPGYHLDMKYSAVALFRRWLGVGPDANIMALSSCAIVALATAGVARHCWRPATAVFAVLAGCCMTAGLWVNLHLNHYDLLPMSVIVVLAFCQWPSLSGAGRVALLTVAAVVYACVPWDMLWSQGAVVPVPGLAIVGLWLLLLWRLVVDQEPQATEVEYGCGDGRGTAVSGH